MAGSPSRETENTLLTREYQNLWKDAGVDGFPKHEGFSIIAKCRAAAVVKPPQVMSLPPTKIESLESIQSWLGDCKRCGLCQTRKKIVFGTGSRRAALMFIGEGPGADEDAEGIPFVGKAGQLLTKIIEAMGYQREEVYIANVVKCRPPGNRTPLPEEAEQCLPFLKAQIDVIRPKVIVALGLVATNALLNSEKSMSNMRSRFQKSPFSGDTWVMPTYHPAYLLRNPAAKKLVWDDMKLVKAKLQTLS